MKYVCVVVGWVGGVSEFVELYPSYLSLSLPRLLPPSLLLSRCPHRHGPWQARVAMEMLTLPQAGWSEAR